MAHDTLVLECPLCKEQFPVATYSGNCSNSFYSVEDCPLNILLEVNKKSKNEEIMCIHCGIYVAVQILYIANIRPLSNCRRENWRIE
jgi:hypothetical protein